MASGLKLFHPYLYRRVRLKGIVFTLLGLSSIFSNHIDRLVHAARNGASTGLNPVFTGGIFLVIGLGILVNLYIGDDNYKKARIFLYAGFVYALFWEFVLLLLAITKNISTVSIFILWGYLTYNLMLIARDSAWEGAEIVREITEGNDGTT